MSDEVLEGTPPNNHQPPFPENKMTLGQVLNELRSRQKDLSEKEDSSQIYAMGYNKGLSEAIRLLENAHRPKVDNSPGKWLDDLKKGL